jgi:MFS family permease
LPIGRWADIYGIFKTYKTGMIIFTIASLMCGIVKTGFWFIVFRFIQGFGSAFSNATSSAILVSSFPQQYRGRILGISVSSVYLGLATGPFFGGIITQYLGWRALFYLSTILGIFVTILAFLVLKDEKESYTKKSEQFRYLESIVYMIGLILLIYGASKIPNSIGWALMLAGIIVLIIFINIEKKSQSPLLDIKLFSHNRLFAFSNMAALINYIATYSIVFLLSLYLQKIKGLNPRDAGSILIAQPIVMTIFSPITGRLSDKIQPHILASSGMMICTLGLLSLSFLTPAFPIFLIIIILLTIGFGFALFSSPNMNTIMSSVEKHQLGLASASAATMRILGQITSMTIVTIYFSILISNQSIQNASPAVFLSIVKNGFLTFAIICLIGVYFSFNRGKLHR